MMAVQQHCMGYSNGCLCTQCDARSEGVQAGALYYDAQGRLRYKGRDQAFNGQALVAYMRDRDRKASMLRPAA